MKNALVIELDTDNQAQPIAFKKLEGTKEPESNEEAAEMIFIDISTLVNGLAVLVSVAERGGLAEKGQLKKDIIAALNHILPDVAATAEVETQPE